MNPLSPSEALQQHRQDPSLLANAVAARLPAGPGGRLAENLMHFGRILRAAGMPIGPDRMLRAIEALELVGLERRDDVHAALSAVMVDRHEHQGLFDEAFYVFWRDPKLLEKMMYLLLPKIEGRGRREEAPNPQRLIDGFAAKQNPPKPAQEPKPQDDEIQLDASMTFSERERLAQMDFETMSTEEYAKARDLVQKLPLPVPEIRTRRNTASTQGLIDLQRALRRMHRDPFAVNLPRREPRYRAPPLVVLVDISGSMHRYSRIFLHFVHALSRRHARVHTLTFGTRLTNITRCLRQKDVDVALARASQQVADWSGGTRIGQCLAEFNQHWSRRLLSGNAGVLLLTDGLDRDDTAELRQQMQKLRLSAHHIVWLNPLLRYQGFEPKPAGIRAMLPYVDRFVPAHNLNSLTDLGKVLAAARHDSAKNQVAMQRWLDALPRPA